jgi:hypothetical protein
VRLRRAGCEWGVARAGARRGEAEQRSRRRRDRAHGPLSARWVDVPHLTGGRHAHSTRRRLVARPSGNSFCHTESSPAAPRASRRHGQTIGSPESRQPVLSPVAETCRRGDDICTLRMLFTDDDLLRTRVAQAPNPLNEFCESPAAAGVGADVASRPAARIAERFGRPRRPAAPWSPRSPPPGAARPRSGPGPRPAAPPAAPGRSPHPSRGRTAGRPTRPPPVTR